MQMIKADSVFICEETRLVNGVKGVLDWKVQRLVDDLS